MGTRPAGPAKEGIETRECLQRKCKQCGQSEAPSMPVDWEYNKRGICSESKDCGW